ncbi:hypothetical protein Pfo_005397 [Paulownia fortunei]|nr:hypothetical protein Pfo_005397 [Paulownia fortunei]
MHPHFNSHLYNPNNQLQINGATASAPQQAIGNQGNFRPNPLQIRPQFQLGILNNPQLAMPPFTNPNAYFAPTQFFPFPQGSLQNLNTNNLPQLFAHNAVNPPQFLPNGQLNVPNLVQNVNQLLQMQMTNCGPQNLGPFVNARMGLANGNGVVPQSVDGNGLKHINHNAAVTKDFGSPQTHRNQNVFSPGAAKSQSNAGVLNGDNDRKNSWRKSHNQNFIGNHKHDASQRGFSKRQFHHRQNAQGNFKFNNENRGKGNKNNGVKNFNLSNPCKQIHVGKKRSLVLNYTEQEIQQWREARRKNYPSNANMEKTLLLQKLKENPTQPEVTDAVAKIRRQQLKEILAKQAELGCEVAEVPSCYLSDSELQTDGRQQNKKEFSKRERFRNKFDKKGKFHPSEQFSKRQRSENSDSANLQNQSDRFTKKQRLANGCTTNLRTDSKREPSLLTKLLSSDIKKDKKHLLQVFRFMVMNSFFKNWPEKSLKFPVVIVKESCDENGILEEKPQVVKDDASDGLASATVENYTVCTGDFDDSSSEEADALDKNAASCSRAYAVAEDEGERLQELGEID